MDEDDDDAIGKEVCPRCKRCSQRLLKKERVCTDCYMQLHYFPCVECGKYFRQQDSRAKDRYRARVDEIRPTRTDALCYDCCNPISKRAEDECAKCHRPLSEIRARGAQLNPNLKICSICSPKPYFMKFCSRHQKSTQVSSTGARVCRDCMAERIACHLNK